MIAGEKEEGEEPDRREFHEQPAIGAGNCRPPALTHMASIRGYHAGQAKRCESGKDELNSDCPAVKLALNHEIVPGGVDAGFSACEPAQTIDMRHGPTHELDVACTRDPLLPWRGKRGGPRVRLISRPNSVAKFEILHPRACCEMPRAILSIIQRGSVRATWVRRSGVERFL